MRHLQIVESNFFGGQRAYRNFLGALMDYTCPAGCSIDTGFQRHALLELYAHRNFLGINLAISMHRNVLGTVMYRLDTSWDTGYACRCEVQNH